MGLCPKYYWGHCICKWIKLILFILETELKDTPATNLSAVQEMIDSCLKYIYVVQLEMNKLEQNAGRKVEKL